MGVQATDKVGTSVMNQWVPNLLTRRFCRWFQFEHKLGRRADQPTSYEGGGSFLDGLSVSRHLHGSRLAQVNFIRILFEPKDELQSVKWYTVEVSGTNSENCCNMSQS
jgi:hypothetical protein